MGGCGTRNFRTEAPFFRFGQVCESATFGLVAESKAGGMNGGGAIDRGLLIVCGCVCVRRSGVVGRRLNLLLSEAAVPSVN